MAQQQNQLRDLADWLTTAERRMEESAAVGSDLEAVKRQVDEHKVSTSYDFYGVDKDRS